MSEKEIKAMQEQNTALAAQIEELEKLKNEYVHKINVLENEKSECLKTIEDMQEIIDSMPKATNTPGKKIVEYNKRSYEVTVPSFRLGEKIIKANDITEKEVSVLLEMGSEILKEVKK